MKWTKFELSLAIGFAVALAVCMAEPRFLMNWWGVAFEPLCDGVLTGEGGEGIVLRSKLWELLTALV